MGDLVDELTNASEGSRVLDAKVWCAVNGYIFNCWDGAGCVYRRVALGTISHERADRIPNYTVSLDASVNLGEAIFGPRNEYDLTTLYGVARATTNMNHGENGWAGYGSNVCGDAPLAMCAAILKAREPIAQPTHEGGEP